MPITRSGARRCLPSALLLLVLLGGAGDVHAQRERFGASGRVTATEVYTMSRMSQPEVVALGEQIVFAGEDVTGLELFISDGTKRGTRELANIHPEGSSNPTDLTVVGDLVFFVADDDFAGRELWCTDGTTAGTRLVRDISEGAWDSHPDQLLAVGDLLLFVADDGFHGRELWRSDGTEEGTFMVLDIDPGARSSNPSRMTVDRDLAYFTAEDSRFGRELWRSDGSNVSTRRVVRSFAAGPMEPGEPEYCNGFVYFSAWTERYGRELWALEVTGEEAFLVSDLNPGEAGSHPERIRAVGDRVYFSADVESTGRELWCSDGTEEHTFLVSDIAQGRASSNPNDYFEANGRVCFVARDGRGRELWTTDRSLSGTRVLLDINGGSGSAFPDHDRVSRVELPGGTLFMADDGNDGQEPWFTNGTRRGTWMVADLNPFGDSRQPAVDDRRMGFAVTRDRVYFAADSGDGPALWYLPLSLGRPGRR